MNVATTMHLSNASIDYVSNHMIGDNDNQNMNKRDEVSSPKF